MPISAVDKSLIAKAQEVSKSSPDPHRQVGAIIASGEQVVSSGVNEPPRSLRLTSPDVGRSIENDPSWKYYVFEHAERNAIFGAWDAGISMHGATIYGTLFPCADCARAIATAGITRVVVPRPGLDASRDEKWLEHYRYAERIFESAQILVEYFDATDHR